MQEYARRADDPVLVKYATEVRMSAEKLAGDLVAEMEKNKGTRGQAAGTDGSGGIVLKPPESNVPTLPNSASPRRSPLVGSNLRSCQKKISKRKPKLRRIGRRTLPRLPTEYEVGIYR
jgi:hypothetical protein